MVLFRILERAFCHLIYRPDLLLLFSILNFLYILVLPWPCAPLHILQWTSTDLHCIQHTKMLMVGRLLQCLYSCGSQWPQLWKLNLRIINMHPLLSFIHIVSSLFYPLATSMKMLLPAFLYWEGRMSSAYGAASDSFELPLLLSLKNFDQHLKCSELLGQWSCLGQKCKSVLPFCNCCLLIAIVSFLLCKCHLFFHHILVPSGSSPNL